MASDIITGAFTLGGSALTGAVAWLVARTSRRSAVEAETARWHRERVERAFVALLTAGEACRLAQVNLMHQLGGKEQVEETARDLVAAVPLLKITASELSNRAVQDYVTAVLEASRAVTEDGDWAAAAKEVTITFGEVEIMARQELGVSDFGFAAHVKY